nr:GntP family permease [bacterium]
MLGPLPCLVIGIASILVLMLYFRFHAFLALISAAIITAVISDRIPLENSLPLVAAEFGNMMANIGILLVMAAIIGKCLMDSGAADRIVRAFTRLFGAGREHYS